MILHLLSYLALNQGSVVNASLEPADHLYIEFPPEVDSDTQQSIITAWRLSDYGRGAKIKFSSNVGGPSAGLAFYIGFLCMRGRMKCDGVCATGVLSANGTVMPVGGLVEKLRAAQKYCRTIYVPAEDEAFLYILRRRGMDIRVVKTVANLPAGLTPSLELPPVPNKTYAFKHREEWRYIYAAIRARAVHEADEIGVDINDYIAHTDEIAQHGFYYGASNYVFLLLTDLLMAKRFLGMETSPQCVRPRITEECLALDAGAAARYWWAQEMMNNSPETAEAWCIAAEAMDKACNGTHEIYADRRLFLDHAINASIVSLKTEAGIAAFKNNDVGAALYSWAFDERGDGVDGYWADVYGSQAVLTGDEDLRKLGRRIDKNLMELKTKHDISLVLWILESLWKE